MTNLLQLFSQDNMKTVRNIFLLDIEKKNMSKLLTSLRLDKKFFWVPTPKNLRKPPPPRSYIQNASYETYDPFKNNMTRKKPRFRARKKLTGIS